MEDIDKELLTRYRRGDVEALERLVGKYRRPLFGYIINITGRQEGGDDIFQEVWLRVIKKIGTYSHKNFLGWLIRIAHNIVIDRARRRKFDVSLDEEQTYGRSMVQVISDNKPDPSAVLLTQEDAIKMTAAVAGLPIEQKEVFILRVKSGLSFREIAKVQRVSINTAIARMQYALTKLKKSLKDDYAMLNE